MNALVTGGGGFAGRHLVALLLARGHRVIAAGHHCPVEIDLREATDVQDLLADARPDVVFHLAGTATSAAMRRDPIAGHLNISRPTVALLDAVLANHAGTRLVLVSHCLAYGRPTRLPIPEDHALAPLDTFAAARAAMEHVARNYLPHGVDIVIARPFHHAGPGQRDGWIPSWRHDGPPDDATRALRRDLSDVRDIVEGYLCVAENGKTGEAYNLCSGATVALGDVYDQLAACSPAPLPATPRAPDPAVRPEVPVLWGDPSRAEALGWRRGYTLEQTIRDACSAVPTLPTRYA